MNERPMTETVKLALLEVARETLRRLREEREQEREAASLLPCFLRPQAGEPR